VTDRRTDTESFETLAMPMFASLYNFAHWLTHNREEAEDLVQETYLKALKGFSAQPSLGKPQIVPDCVDGLAGDFRCFPAVIPPKYRISINRARDLSSRARVSRASSTCSRSN
jgi:hypothetical protein